MTLTQWTQDTLTDICREWMDERRMFTALEVSLAAKERGVQQRHRDLKHVIHAAMLKLAPPRGYTRTLLDVGAPIDAWVYHHLHQNPRTYLPLQSAESALAQTIALNNAPAVTPEPAAVSNWMDLTLKFWGVSLTFHLPCRFGDRAA